MRQGGPWTHSRPLVELTQAVYFGIFLVGCSGSYVEELTVLTCFSAVALGDVVEAWLDSDSMRAAVDGGALGNLDKVALGIAATFVEVATGSILVVDLVIVGPLLLV